MIKAQTAFATRGRGFKSLHLRQRYQRLWLCGDTAFFFCTLRLFRKLFSFFSEASARLGTNLDDQRMPLFFCHAAGSILQP
jgi:hypothetical protein